LEEEERVLIEEAELFCAKHEKYRSVYHVVMQCLFKNDLVKARLILEWAEHAQQSIKTHTEKEELKKMKSLKT